MGNSGGLSTTSWSRKRGLLGPLLFAAVFIAATLGIRWSVHDVAAANRASRAAETARADLNWLAVLHNAAEAGQPVERSNIEQARSLIINDLEDLLAEVPEERRDDLRSDVYRFIQVDTMVPVSSPGQADSVGINDTDWRELHDQLASELGDLMDASVEDGRRAERVASYGLLLGGLGAAMLLLAIAGLEVRRRTRSAFTESSERATRRFQSLIEDSNDHIYVFSATGDIHFMSPSAIRWAGEEFTELGQLLERTGPKATRAVVQKLEEGGGSVEVLVTLEQHHAWFDVTIVDRTDDLDVRGIVMTAHEVTESVELRHRLERQATEDELTGLPNRRAITAAAEAALARATRTDTAVAMVLVDLDGFKNINDTLGHPVGDELLRQVGRRLSATVREGELLGRLAGDEFAIIIESANAARESSALTARALHAVAEPYTLEGQLLAVSGSAGVVIANPGDDVDQLLRFADIALYEAKRTGRSRSVVFDPSMEEPLVIRSRILQMMESAAKNDEFTLAYQPLFDVATGETLGFEALMRWHNEELGHVSPATFIPIAEQSGLIGRLGMWALLEACNRLAAWQDATGNPTLGVSVNASVVQLHDPTFPEQVRTAFTVAGIEPRFLQIEVTESVLIGDEAQVLSCLHAVRELGVRVALDDFGTGYSSMSQLRALPVSCLKIDRSFVSGTDDEDGRRIALALIELGKALGLKVIAEGIETEAQLELLRSAGCHVAQGFLLGRPMEDTAVFAHLHGERQGRGLASGRLSR